MSKKCTLCMDFNAYININKSETFLLYGDKLVAIQMHLEI